MSYGWQKAPRDNPGAPPGGLQRLKKTEAPEAELEDEAAALPPASSSSPASPLRPPEEIKPPARGACRAEEKTPVVVAASQGDDDVRGRIWNTRHRSVSQLSKSARTPTS